MPSSGVVASSSAVATYEQPLDGWITKCVERTANAQPNDGTKVSTLVAKAPLSYDSRYMLH